MLETLREVRRQEYQKLWGRVPGSVGSALWIVAVAVFGWNTAVWLGALVSALLTLLSLFVTSSWRPVELVIDLAYLTVMRSNVLRVLWLVLIVYLWLIASAGPLAIPMVLVLYVAALLVPFLTRRILRRLTARQLATA